jgi:hypothetical protein
VRDRLEKHQLIVTYVVELRNGGFKPSNCLNYNFFDRLACALFYALVRNSTYITDGLLMD